jgi:hypothetical protein
MKKQSRLTATHRKQMPRAPVDEAENAGPSCRFIWSMIRIFTISTQVMKKVDR